ncbi:MAG: type IV secretory system conjugative DNA transfer family protein [Verrucomicrobiales bacterium]|nr:type IV secretory system conjugative DNA transfer family protein [Verrucomicrobiales bacterium]
MTAKPDERALWERYCKETGRHKSLIVFGPANRWKFNFLDYEYRRPGVGAGLTQNLLVLFSSVLEVAERGHGASGSQDYWSRTLRQIMRNAIDLAAIGRGRVTLPDLYDIVVSAPNSPEEMKSEEWQMDSACMSCVRDGEAKTKNPLQAHDWELAVKYWLKEFPNLAPKTRSIIVSSFTSLTDIFLRGMLYDLFCTETNIVPEMTHTGAIIVLDLPVKEYAEVGQLAQVLFKFIWQRATERRDIRKHPRPVFLWADESQLFVNSHDAVFQTTARSSRTCTVYLTQNLSNYYAALGGERSKAEVNSLLGNLQTKIFHANGDSVTNNWAADLFAKSFHYKTTSGTSTRDGESGSTSRNTGGHESLENQVQPIEFSRLRKGGPENDWCVDAFVFEGGREWRATGKNYLRVTFNQH